MLGCTPKGEEVTPAILQVSDTGKGKVELLHPGKELEFEVKGKSLEISVPGDLPDDLACAFKLTGFKTSLTPEAQARRDAALSQLQSAPIDPGKKQADNIMFGRE